MRNPKLKQDTAGHERLLQMMLASLIVGITAVAALFILQPAVFIVWVSVVVAGVVNVALLMGMLVLAADRSSTPTARRKAVMMVFTFTFAAFLLFWLWADGII